ncbi:hypothetical protein WAF17_07340 [Bernardetia sp. ABR2-2B]|uniref:hypothetical protein n=1 Tax=Bernardetia sp. ABR2-2B TaxID=3127472 RepID=UPI0030D594CE
MWQTNTIWFDISIVSTTIALGHILLGHFEERTSRWKKLTKYIFILVVVISLSYFFGQKIALISYSLLYIPVLYIHLIDLPKKGINGWTGKPKEKYYELRSWNKNIFDEE